METIDVLIRRKGTHGMPIEPYGAAIRERLPDHNVVVAHTPDEEASLIKRARVLSSVHVSQELLEKAETLELFAGVAAGYDHLPLDQFSKQGVIVTNAAGIHAPNIAEQVLGYILMHTRRLEIAINQTQRSHWQHFQAGELNGSTVTVVGLGAIGMAVVDRLRGFGVETIGVRYTPSKGGPTDEVIGFDDAKLQSALARTDYLILAAPLSETTRGLIDKRAFDTLPPDCYLVNVGRGPVVDTDDLVTALRSDELSGAGLDVTDPEPLPADHPLWDFNNVIITPHNAGHTPKHWERLADIVAMNVEQLDTQDQSGEFVNVIQQPE
jgi:phosphoglycerate dehydrogenase-like enzyme